MEEQAPLEVAQHVPYTWRGINGPDWEYGKEQTALATRAEILWAGVLSAVGQVGEMHRWSDSLLHVIFPPQGLST